MTGAFDDLPEVVELSGEPEVVVSPPSPLPSSVSLAKSKSGLVVILSGAGIALCK